MIIDNFDIVYIYIYTHVSYSINSLFYSWLLILERAVSDIEQLGSSMSHRYHPRPISLPGCNSNEYRGGGGGGRNRRLYRGWREGRVSVCLLVRRGFSRGALAWKNQPGER